MSAVRVTLLGLGKVASSSREGEMTSSNVSLMTLTEVAARLRRTPDAVRAMVTRGQIVRPTKIGARLFWAEEDLEAWLSAQFKGETQ